MHELPRNKSFRVPASCAALMSVVLHPQIFDKELDREIVVCLNPADPRGR